MKRKNHILKHHDRSLQQLNKKSFRGFSNGKIFSVGFYEETKLDELEGIQARDNDQSIEQQNIYKK